jgi:glutamate-5-semialdehyde dehydrogenase
MDDFKNIFTRAKAAAQDLLALDDERRVQILNAVAGATLAHQEELLRANAEDLARMDPQNPLYDRLALNPERLEGIAADMRQVAALPSPLDRILEERTMPNGLRIRKISVPFGVVGVVYEARPNVTFDVFSLCFKSGSACLLKGGRDADRSNRYAVSLIRGILERFDVNPDAVILLPATREAVHALLTATGWVDLVIPRGGRGLIDFVREHAKVPTIETGAGVVNTFFDKDADLEIGKAIVYNAKTRRPGVCNALDCLLIHQDRLKDLQALCLPLLDHRVEFFADEAAFAALDGAYPADLLHPAGPDTFGTEFLSFKMGIRTVASLDEALAHIHEYGSGHSESIVTEDSAVADRFRRQVDAACVYVNAPTSFTDGAQFGLGAEIGISTQKLGARGPMGLREITTYKWLIDGRGQMRP